MATRTTASDGDPPAEGDAADGEQAVDWQAFVPTDTADHLATMDRAARESGCGVPWQLLAAIARVESDFGRNMATSSAGAIGYGQFLPSSWQAFGNDGNVYDYRVALPAIATYLCQSGLASDPRAALYAYNHADWYVDLVLDLAVRYDRMAPGAPTPDVLDLNPAADAVRPLHYAAGRDLRLQARGRANEGQATWLGVPWRGRPPRAANSAATLEATTVAMLRAAFGLTGEAPTPAPTPRAGPRAVESSPPGQTMQAGQPGMIGTLQAGQAGQPGTIGSLADRAWAGGLFANPRALGEAWSVGEIRRRIEAGQSVVALLNARLLPGHDPSDGAASGDQPIVLVGVTPNGLVYSDPSFSSSLGYGLELSDADFVTAWQAASTPLQALAISTRPEPPARDDYFRGLLPRQLVTVFDAMPTSLVADASAVAAGGAIAPAAQARGAVGSSRGLATAPPIAGAGPEVAGAEARVSGGDSEAPGPDPTVASADPTVANADARVASPAGAESGLTLADDATHAPKTGLAADEGDRSWLILAGAAVLLGGALGFRPWRARRP